LPTLRVAVVGGGVLGVSTAQQLLRGGAEVVLVTDGALGSGATGRSLSWLNSAGARRESYHLLRMAGIDRYRTLAARHPGAAAWLRFDGGLSWSAPDLIESLLARHRHEVAHGYESRLLMASEVCAEVAGVEIAAIPESGAVWNPGEGWVDLPSLVRFLVDDFHARGGRLLTHAGRCAVELAGGAVSAIRTADGNHLAVDAAVVATGPAVPSMVSGLGVCIPDATPVSLLVTTSPVRHDLAAVLNTPRVSLRPTPAGALAVDADWPTENITRRDIDERGDGPYPVPRRAVEELLAEASGVLAGHPRLVADQCGIGRKPIPGDGEPVLGRVDDVPGLSLAFTHSGATLGLIAGELIADEILHLHAHPMLADFNVRRFSDGPPRGG
jgi:glycine/D-amino acid oxidase-like deaminating enzyme